MNLQLPTATELFISLWNAELSRMDPSGEACTCGPGDDDFDDLTIRDWVKTWEGCLRMSKAISQHEMSK